MLRCELRKCIPISKGGRTKVIAAASKHDQPRQRSSGQIRARNAEHGSGPGCREAIEDADGIRTGTLLQTTGEKEQLLSR